MICVGRIAHDWDWDSRPWPSEQAQCRRCGISRRHWDRDYHDRIHKIRAFMYVDRCPYCREEGLRRRAYDEQARVRAALKADEAEVLALYGRKDNHMNRWMFLWRTPDQARREFPAWHAERTERMERQRQRRRLREGHRKLTAIRRYLRDRDVSRLPVSEPATSSPT